MKPRKVSPIKARQIDRSLGLKPGLALDRYNIAGGNRRKAQGDVYGRTKK